MIDYIFSTFGYIPVLKSLAVLLITMILLSILALVVNAIAYFALAQDDLDKPLFKITGLFSKIFKFLMVPQIKWNSNYYSYTWGNLLPFLSNKLFTNHEYTQCYLRKYGDDSIGGCSDYKRALDCYLEPNHSSATLGISFWHIACLLFRLVLAGIFLDLSLLAFTYSPLATLSVLGTISTLFATRFISKKLWKVTAKTDNHEDRISKLEG